MGGSPPKRGCAGRASRSPDERAPDRRSIPCVLRPGPRTHGEAFRHRARSLLARSSPRPPRPPLRRVVGGAGRRQWSCERLCAPQARSTSPVSGSRVAGHLTALTEPGSARRITSPGCRLACPDLSSSPVLLLGARAAVRAGRSGVPGRSRGGARLRSPAARSGRVRDEARGTRGRACAGLRAAGAPTGVDQPRPRLGSPERGARGGDALLRMGQGWVALVFVHDCNAMTCVYTRSGSFAK